MMMRARTFQRKTDPTVNLRHSIGRGKIWMQIIMVFVIIGVILVFQIRCIKKMLMETLLSRVVECQFGKNIV